MQYFAKLAVGGTYILRGFRFDRGVEHQVTKEEAEYLKSLKENRLISQGDKYAVIGVERFKVREEAPTVEQKVLEEIKKAPDTLKPTKPTKEAE